MFSMFDYLLKETVQYLQASLRSLCGTSNIRYYFNCTCLLVTPTVGFAEH